MYRLDWRKESLDMILPAVIIDHYLEYSKEAEALIRNNMDFALAIVLSSGHLDHSWLEFYGRNEVFLQTVYGHVRFIYPSKPSNLSDRLQMWYLSLTSTDVYRTNFSNSVFDFVSDKVLLDYNAYRANPELLCRAPDHIKSDREFVLELMKENSSVLRHASVELRRDMEVALAWIPGKDSWIYKGVVHEDLLSNKEYALRHFKNAAKLYASKDYQEINIPENTAGLRYDVFNLEIYLARMYLRIHRAEADYLGDFSKELRNDRDVVIAAVTATAGAFRWASDELRDDRELASYAIEKDGSVFRDVSERLEGDKLLLSMALEKSGDSYLLVYSDLRDDKDFVLQQVASTPSILQWTSARLKGDRDVVTAAIEKDGQALQYASYELRSDKELLLQAVMTDPKAFSYVPKELQEYRGLCEAAFERQPDLVVPVARALDKACRAGVWLCTIS